MTGEYPGECQGLCAHQTSSPSCECVYVSIGMFLALIQATKTDTCTTIYTSACPDMQITLNLHLYVI